MKKLLAIILIPLGIIVPVALAILQAVVFNVDVGRQPGFLLPLIMPGVAILAWARHLWRSGETSILAQEPIPPGYRVCGRCRQVVPETGGKDQGYGGTPMTFICDACTSYRNRRAIMVVLLLIVPLAACGLAGFLLDANSQKRKR
jgi:hypothetical protein